MTGCKGLSRMEWKGLIIVFNIFCLFFGCSFSYLG